MDPLAHSLVGASLAQTGLKRLTPLATATLVLGANLPDVDGVLYLWDQDLALGLRRGWTHGVLALIVLPPVLALLVAGFDRMVRRRWRATAPPIRPGPLVALSYGAALTHPLLDWLNAYGVRLLMPFSERWFYGDALFIVDPWLWLLGASGVVIASSRQRAGLVTWLVLGLGSSAIILGSAMVPLVVKALWLGGVGAIVLLRLLPVTRRRSHVVARVALVLAAAYAAAMVTGTWLATREARPWLAARGIEVVRIASLPVAANPFVRDVLVATPERYYFVRVTWLAGAPAIAFSDPDVPIGGPSAVTEAALGAPHVWGLRQWLRFPSYEVRRLEDGYRVVIRDVRYWRPNRARSDLGFAVVRLDDQLRPRAEEPRPD
jgi:inner membrane protein